MITKDSIETAYSFLHQKRRSTSGRLLPTGRKNVVSFFMYGVDKWKAKKSKWRIPEATLLVMAVIGGSIGAWLGMKIWHHKTLHKKFRFGVPAIIIVQLALIGYILYRFEI